MPRWSAIWRETQGTISQFFSNAIPIFLAITAIASVLGLITGWINPLMGLFGLPPEAALPVILASIRKDGLLLFAEPDTLERRSSRGALSREQGEGSVLEGSGNTKNVSPEREFVYLSPCSTDILICQVLLVDRRSSNTNTSANLDGCEPQAGRLLPCLVTALTIAREQSVRFAVRLMARQAIAAIVFSMLLAWGGNCL